LRLHANNWAIFKLVAYKVSTNGQEHMALGKGSWKKDEPVLCRVHSSCVTGDVFGKAAGAIVWVRNLHAAMENGKRKKEEELLSI